MFKKSILISLSAFSLVSATLVFAADTVSAKPASKTSQSAPPAPAPAEKKAPITTFSLYDAPNATAKVLGQLPADTDLIGIFQQGDWMKVGNRQNGETGWINLKQYHEAKKAFYRDYFHVNSETIYVHTSKDKDGKQVIEAYRDGKKLSDQEAKKLYDQVKVREQQQFKAMQHFNEMMNREMQLDYQNAMGQFNAMFQSPVLFMPGVVIVEQPKATEKKTESDKRTEPQKASKKSE